MLRSHLDGTLASNKIYTPLRHPSSGTARWGLFMGGLSSIQFEKDLFGVLD
jgi:hypothetical protein